MCVLLASAHQKAVILSYLRAVCCFRMFFGFLWVGFVDSQLRERASKKRRSPRGKGCPTLAVHCCRPICRDTRPPWHLCYLCQPTISTHLYRAHIILCAAPEQLNHAFMERTCEGFGCLKLTEFGEIRCSSSCNQCTSSCTRSQIEKDKSVDVECGVGACADDTEPAWNVPKPTHGIPAPHMATAQWHPLQSSFAKSPVLMMQSRRAGPAQYLSVWLTCAIRRSLPTNRLG